MRPRRPRRAGRSQGAEDPRRGRCSREVWRGTALIPDFLALVGDAADGYPGIPGIGAVTAARLLNRHGIIEDFPRPCWAASASSRCFQGPGNAQDRRAPLRQRGRAALGRPHRRIRRVGGAPGRRPSAAALSCGTKPTGMTDLAKSRHAGVSITRRARKTACRVFSCQDYLSLYHTYVTEAFGRDMMIFTKYARRLGIVSTILFFEVMLGSAASDRRRTGSWKLKTVTLGIIAEKIRRRSKRIFRILCAMWREKYPAHRRSKVRS